MKRPRKHAVAGFTLNELLVVIAVIAILAGILFPVFAQAREKARTSTCLSNCRQMGTGVMMYAQDYDEVVLPFRVPVAGQPAVNTLWTALIQPYIKNGIPVLEGGKYRATGVLSCPSFSEEKHNKAANSVECDGPSFSTDFMPPQHIYATYGIAWASTVVFGTGTQQDPYWHYPGSGNYGGQFVNVKLPMVLRPADTALISDAITMTTGGRRPGGVGGSFGCEAAEMHQGGGNHIFLDGHARWIARNSERYLKQRADGKWFKQFFTYDME